MKRIHAFVIRHHCLPAEKPLVVNWQGLGATVFWRVLQSAVLMIQTPSHQQFQSGFPIGGNDPLNQRKAE